MTGLLLPADAPESTRIEVDDTGARRVLWLRTADVCVGVVPALGGRVLSLVTRAGEHLFRNPELLDDAIHETAKATELGEAPDRALGSWINWGGDKTWPAPQGWSGPGEWPGPPDPVLDGGPYDASWSLEDGCARVDMLSPDDQRTGLRLGRRVEVAPGSSGYRLTSTFTNIGDREIRWAIWQVVQLPGSEAPAQVRPDTRLGIWVGTEADPGEREPGKSVVHLIAGTADLQVDRGCAPVAWVPPQDVVGKVGFPSASGWVAHVATDRVTALRFAPDRAGPYPDRESRVEVWLEHPLDEPLPHLGGLQPRHRVAECEVLGPLRTMAPGSSARLVTHVTGCSGEGPVQDVTEGACVLRPMVAASGPSGLRLTGRLGVFSTGDVTIRFEGGERTQLGEVALGRATAGAPFDVSWESQAPRSTVCVVVCLDKIAIARVRADEICEERR